MVLSIILRVHHHAAGAASAAPGPGEYQSRLHLIDLAGSERISRSGALHDSTQLKEAQSINRSLSALGDVISSLKRKAKHVPYRNSKLTQLLSAALGTKRSKTLMIATVSPDQENAGETVCSLKFAHRTRCVELAGLEDDAEGARASPGRLTPRRSTPSKAPH